MFNVAKKIMPLILALATMVFGAPPYSNAQGLDIGGFGRSVILRQGARLDFYFADKKVELGNPVFLRILRNRGQLQLWVKEKNKYRFIRNYRICGNAANLIDGIYHINAANLMQNGNNFVRIGTDFPNQYNIAQKKKGSVFIAARCASAPSIGITDPDSEELYTILYKSFKKGQKSVDLHIYPNELNPLSALTAPKKSDKKLIGQLGKIYSYFENHHNLPTIVINKNGYVMPKK